MALSRKTDGTFTRENIISLDDENKPPHISNWTNNKHIVINNNTSLSFSNDYYWYYYWGSARASVKVGRGGEASLSSGCWYYEVTIKESGTCRIGWALPTFNPGESTDVKAGDGGDSWAIDGHKKYHAQKEEAFTQITFSSGQIVGTMVDFSTNKIYYCVNGGQLVAVFTQVLADQLYPCLSLQSRCKLEVNFGPNFKKCPVGAFGLNPTLTKNQTQQLEKIFDKYKDPETGAISGRSLLGLLRDLGANSAYHPLVGVVPWRINAGKLLTLTYDEWMCSWALAQVYDFEGIKRISHEWVKETENDERCFSNYYNYTFRYMKNANTSLSPGEAVKGWKLTGVDKKWKFWDLWEKFVMEKNTHITWSVWDQFLPFIKTIGGDPKKFDENDMWPLFMEEFYEAKLKKL